MADDGRDRADDGTADDGGRPDLEDTASFEPVEADPLALGAIADVTDAEATARRESHRQTIGLVIFAVLAVLLAAAAIGGYAYAKSYFADKAAPGVLFAGGSVAGRTSSQLTGIVRRAVSATRFTLTDSKGRRIGATLSDLGVTVDVRKTVTSIMAAKKGEGMGRLNPLERVSVPLKATTDDTVLADYLADGFVAKSDRPTASSVSYDSVTGKFVVDGGTTGTVAQTYAIEEALQSAIEEPGGSHAVSFRYERGEMPISIAAATKVAARANSRLGAITLTGGDKVTYVIPSATIASWTVLKPHAGKGTIALSYDREAIGTYLDKELPSRFGKTAVAEKDVVDSSGKVVLVDTKGVDGLKVTNADDVADEVHDALTSGDKATVQVDTTTVTHGRTTTTVDMSLVVDLSTQTVMAYKGSDKVAEFLVCVSGQAAGSSSGDVYVTDHATSAKLTTSTSSSSSGSSDGKDAGDSSTKDPASSSSTTTVQWVSYFGSSQAFLSATWNSDGIASGDPRTASSDAFVEMYSSDAQWIVENCPKGTKVSFTGAEPSKAVR
ncbi:hypothetical protein [uncultured Bifidobacterium sp.]|uniref:hypothetical protein n=1 Tax=uncultured Bifidobacterium sp. TaxID=165187 RepID=UPI0028DC3A6E|nr:hypothetical protein [uncultured Bifidobacterium sp.]